MTARVIRPDDNLRTQERAAVGINFLDEVFAGDFEAAIGLGIHVGHVLAGGRHSGMGFADRALSGITIDTDGTDKHIALDASVQLFSAGPHLPGGVTAHVHAHIPGTPRQGCQAGCSLITVAAQPFHVGGQLIR